MGSRRRARELTLQFLYQYDTLNESSSEKVDLEEALTLFGALNEKSADNDTDGFAALLMRGTNESTEGIDRIINRFSEHWKLSRMPRIDRNILRLAVYEMVYMQETPYPVVINEAIEIAKKFGSEESGAFVNGILDQIRMAMEKGEIGRAHV